MSDGLDSLVKGSPMPDASPSPTAPNTLAPGSPTPGPGTGPGDPGASSKAAADPLHNTPSSPPMIYLNLLILEASLRAQYLELRARRRHHTFFLLLLAFWTSGFGYALFFAPREDGRGQGGSVYWAVEVIEKLCFMGGVITGILVWGTGIWERGVRWPRRWLVVSNRGLRPFNCKVVLLKRSWCAEMLSTLAWFLTYGLFSAGSMSSYRYVDVASLREVDRELGHTPHDQSRRGPGAEDEASALTRGHDEDVAPGGDYVKLLLLPKPFSATFRENWDLYRTEYWERENERRALLRAKLKQRDQMMAREQFGWLWWLRWNREAATASASASAAVQDLHGHKSHLSHHKRVRSLSIRGSTSSTRSQTPAVEMDGFGRARRASTTSPGPEKRKKRSPLASPRGSLRSRRDSRSVTPDFQSPLARQSIYASDESAAGVGVGITSSKP